MIEPAGKGFFHERARSPIGPCLGEALVLTQQRPADPRTLTGSLRRRHDVSSQRAARKRRLEVDRGHDSKLLSNGLVLPEGSAWYARRARRAGFSKSFA